MPTVLLLIASNAFMTVAWYGHLRYREAALSKAILFSWLIASVEYALQVPANRIGYRTFTAYQLKIIQKSSRWRCSPSCISAKHRAPITSSRFCFSFAR